MRQNTVLCDDTISYCRKMLRYVVKKQRGPLSEPPSQTFQNELTTLVLCKDTRWCYLLELHCSQALLKDWQVNGLFRLVPVHGNTEKFITLHHKVGA